MPHPFRRGDVVRRLESGAIGRVVDFIDEDGRELVLVRWFAPDTVPNPSAEPPSDLVKVAGEGQE
jgi:hypothetical protein